ncbi:protein kinase [bacterium]|nr:protein kinase [bacterium]
MIGQTVSHYQILEKLGEGGMGVVYKAQDTTLDRIVALKFLPHYLNSNDEERARFLQEAKAASALNHPNVCTIYGIEEHEGQQFIEMEYVDGVTMKHKFTESPLKISDTITYALQIGEALQEAHANGIVHRDVKSENIMVNSKNQIKVMDFGLAKLRGSIKLTKSSSTTGTLAYMAPEQIQGQQVDARADIFSFGVVLYEMLTGHTPFRGEHEAAMIYSIVNEEPQPIQKFREDITSELMHVLNRALEKDPEERYQTVKDMTIDLRRLKKESTRVSRSVIMETPGEYKNASTTSTEFLRPKKKLWIGISATLVVMILLVSIWFFRKSTELNPDMTFRVLQIPFTQISYPGISSDGKWIAFPGADANSRWDVYFMNSSGGEPRRITSDSALFTNRAEISPDGSQIVYDRVNDFTRFSPEICIVPSLGGISTAIVKDGFSPLWRPDGERIGYMNARNSEFWSVKIDGSDKRCEFIDSLSQVQGSLTRVSFAWSPDGRSIAWLTNFAGFYQEIFVWDLTSHQSRQLTFDKKNIDEVAWTQNDQIIFSSNKGGNTNLWIIPSKGGQAVQLTKGSGPDLGVRTSWDNKKLIYMQQQNIGHLWIAGLDGSSARQLTYGDQSIINPDVSPDGKHIIFQMSESDPLKALGQSIYMINRDGSGQRPLTSGELTSRNPGWSPDGKWIAYHARRPSEPPDSSKIFLIDANNPGTPKFIGRGGSVYWINESSLIAFHSSGSWLTFIDGSPQQKFFEDSTSSFPMSGGQLISYIDNHAGKEGLYIVKSGEPSTKAKKILTGNFQLLSIVGKSVYYINASNELQRINVVTGAKEKVNGAFPGLLLGASGQVRSDEKEIVYADQQVRSKLVLVDNLFK